MIRTAGSSSAALVWVLASLVSAASLLACGNLEHQPLGNARLEIIGGLLAPSDELDHTGVVARIHPATGSASPLCTATLVGRETVVTARHCADTLAPIERSADRIVWARGADLEQSQQRVDIASIELPERGAEPGALGIGLDVALLHLAEPVDVPPVVVRAWDPSSSHVALVSLGYGMPAAWRVPDGRRRIGREQVAATAGLVYEILYGDFEGFLEAEAEAEAPRAADPLALSSGGALDVEALRQRYERTRLIPEHELITRTLPGSTRGCRGDSGGPLLRVGPTGEWELYGVLSGGPRSARAECDLGQVYAIFGPQTFGFVEAGSRWTDPCGDVDATGVCDGGERRRCETSLASRERRLVLERCTARR